MRSLRANSTPSPVPETPATTPIPRDRRAAAAAALAAVVAIPPTAPTRLPRSVSDVVAGL